MKSDNKNVYESSELAQRYSREEKLQPPEASILTSIKLRLNGSRMLDIGVGGGRTTLHFAPLVGSYVGIDYSEQMIAACKERFGEIPNLLTFQMADVRSLSSFPDHDFDFVLFSYNGLDYIPHDSRPDALREIRRVLKKNGCFALSTHNLNSLQQRLRVRPVLRPRALASKLLWTCRFLWHNRALHGIGTTGYCEVYDGALAYRLRTHYSTPEFTVQELTQSGFRDIQVFALSTGERIHAPGHLRAKVEDWLYYLCTV
ncbi:MAG: methyltransferase domain-containing protein [Terriglobales bacterium]